MLPPPVLPALLVSLLGLTTALPAQQPPASDDSVASLLGPAMEATLARALSRWQPPALAQVDQLRARLEAVESQLASVQTSPLYLPWLAHERTGRVLSPHTCEEKPDPLPAGQGPHTRPERLACATSCRQLRDRGDARLDGVYWLSGMTVPVLCDFSHDGGGWTLLLTAATREGWNPDSVKARNELSPSLTDNYSILRRADAIRDLSGDGTFEYRIEAQAEKGRRRWGGVWRAPSHYSFVAKDNGQTDVSIITKFDNWSYRDDGIEQRMPWLNDGSWDGLLTTSTSAGSAWWGTLVTREAQTTFHHSPWIHGEAQESGRVLYWVRE